MMTDPPISPEGSRDCGTFFLDAVGCFDQPHVQVDWKDEPRPSNADVERLIEQTWSVELARAAEEHRRLYNGPLCRMIRCQASESRLMLTLGPVTFKELVGTNFSQAYLRYLYGQEVLADPLGVSAAVVTSDQYILMGRRSQKVAFHANRIHPIGGMVEPSTPGTVPNPFQTMRNELMEEINVPADHIKQLVCLGLVRDKHIVQPEMVFDIVVNVSAEQIKHRLRTAVDAEEHDELILIRNHPAAVVTFMEQHFSQLTPVALASLLLHGLKNYGSGWFAAARGYLRSVI